MTRPHFFIIGAPKCGTTSLYRLLKQHPRVFMPEFKEPHHFSHDLWHNTAGDAYRRFATLDGYLSLFDTASPGQVCGEASVFYLYSRVAAREIQAFNPEAKIIAMVRDPVSYLHSLHNQTIINGDEPIDDFNRALTATLHQRRRMGMRHGSRFNYGFDYWAMTRFSEQLQRYIDRFPPHQLKIIVFDDFKADMHGVARDTLKFIGLDTDVDFGPIDRNEAREVRFKPIMDLLWSQHPLRQQAARLIPLSLRVELFKRLALFGTQPRKRPPMTPQTRDLILRETRDEVARLSTMLDRDLTALWSRRPAPTTPD